MNYISYIIYHISYIDTKQMIFIEHFFYKYFIVNIYKKKNFSLLQFGMIQIIV
jgi:hypothetical protein